MLKSLFSFLKRIDSVSEILYRKSISPEVLFSCQKGDMQVCVRYQKLKAMLDKWDEGKLNFQPTCPRGIYNFQIRAMADYIASLEARAAIEDIEL